jgi:hypothetical protein
MDIEFKPMYSCQLVLDLERERRMKVSESIKILESMDVKVEPDIEDELLQASLEDSVRRYCMMGVRRRWHDYQKELTRNVYAVEAGRINEVTMPELITDVDAWSDEDKLVYKALKEAEIMKREK